MAREVATEVARVAAARDLPFVFKASVDKANRTSGDSWRGPGWERGLDWLARLGADLGVPVITDVHEADQAASAARAVDALQIPAFLCRQTDLLRAAAATGLPVNLKKGQFLAPWQVGPAAEKLDGAPEIWLTERGTSFGHGDLVVDFRSVVALRATGRPLLFDASHAAQTPGGAGSASSGDRRWIPVLARAAGAAGYDGLYLEVHPDPPSARSDRDTQWPLADLARLLDAFLAARAARLASE